MVNIVFVIHGCVWVFRMETFGADERNIWRHSCCVSSGINYSISSEASVLYGCEYAVAVIDVPKMIKAFKSLKLLLAQPIPNTDPLYLVLSSLNGTGNRGMNLTSVYI